MFLNFLEFTLLMEFGISSLGISLAIVFFLVFAGIAVFAYKMLKRTVKMAFRMFIVAAILLIAVVGSFALYFGIQTQKEPRPSVRQTPRPAR